ncbi:protein kinase domain-containing protein [Aporhodopirellula aestuarii]|uniref:Protein kinase n=1 Tax=Aporhodopirellula aestuarii TaxID=2950107 RepID=A0ABT0UDW2_9BACT|nr:protein kinase [Aporhodopirellula aestuarii]MCM2375074.1 protein kinase [Aporhodopirellula aestuarii]
MTPKPSFNAEIAQRLPLPIAQLHRRASTAKSATEKHQAAFFLWEASIKLLTTAVILEFSHSRSANEQQLQLLHRLVRPKLADWLAILKSLLPEIGGNDSSLRATSRTLSEKMAESFEPCRQLAETLRRVNEQPDSSGVADSLLDLFTQLPAYRWRVWSQQPGAATGEDSVELIGNQLLAAAEDWLPHVDLLLGRELIFVSGVTARGSDRWIVDRYTLMGDVARRIRDVELVGSTHNLPRAGSVYLDANLDTRDVSKTTCLSNLWSCHPVVSFDIELNQVFFLAERISAEPPQDTEAHSLCYTTGQTQSSVAMQEDLAEFIAGVSHGAFPSPPRTTDSSTVSLTQTTDDSQGPPSPPRRSDQTTGEFELLTRMGQGGMGVVYRAWQPSLAREVAVKSLMRSGDPKSQARFSREIHALARVEHPNLIKIFSSGVEGDHWYYAMELVDGVDMGVVMERLREQNVSVGTLSYSRWFDEFRECVRATRLREELIDESFDIQDRIEQIDATAAQTDTASRDYITETVKLLCQVTAATQSLHEAGVVHRDIKPGNVMLTSDGQDAVLMDLGLAQMEDDTSAKVTRTRQFVGTLRYASPEQVLSIGSIDHRSDVYSLGATLWELLTLRPLFGVSEESSALDMMRRIEYTDPDPVCKYNKAVPKDLDAIVCKCLEKSPDHRYQSAAELQEELTRFLNHEPVQARPLGTAARAARYVRRHPVGSGLALVCLVTLATLGVLAINYRQLQAERQFAAELQTANERADTSFRTAVAALDGIFRILTEGDLRRRPDLQPLRSELLTYYRNYVEQFSEGEQLDEAISLELGQTLQRMARITSELGDKTDAISHYDSAIAIYQGLLPRTQDRTRLTKSIAGTYLRRGVLHQESRDYDRAEKDFDLAKRDLELLLEASPDDNEICQSLGSVHHELGILYELRNEYQEALESYEKGRRIREELVRRVGDRGSKRDLGRSYGYLGDVQIAIGDYQKALHSYIRSMEMRQEVVDMKPADHEAKFQLARSFRNLGHLNSLKNDIEEAIEWYEQALQADRRLIGAEPLIADYRSDLGSYGNDLIELMVDQIGRKEDPKAIAAVQELAAEVYQVNDELTKQNPDQAQYISSFARTLVNLSRLDLLEDGKQQAKERLKQSRRHYAMLQNASEVDLYQQAVLETLLAKTVDDEQEVMTRDIPQIEKHLNEAIELLSQAVLKSRYTIVPRLARDPAFDELQNESDFLALSTIGYRGRTSRAAEPVYRDKALFPPRQSTYQHLYVLAVGVSDYQDAKHSLEYPDDDAMGLSDVFRTQTAFTSVTVETLTNAQASRIAILNKLKQLRMKALHPSLLVVAMSGHGRLHESGDYYFLPYDFDFNPDSSIAATGISWDDLLREFKEIPGAVVVLLDTCHSGAATNIGLRGPGANQMQVRMRQVASEMTGAGDRGVAVLASSLSAQAAQERSSWGHGALSLAVIEALRHQRIYAEVPNPPLPVPGLRQVVSLQQIQSYAVERVNELTEGQQKVIVQSNMSLIDVPFTIAVDDP